MNDAYTIVGLSIARCRHFIRFGFEWLVGFALLLRERLC